MSETADLAARLRAMAEAERRHPGGIETPELEAAADRLEELSKEVGDLRAEIARLKGQP